MKQINGLYFDIAAKRRKKQKIQCATMNKIRNSNFFTNPSYFRFVSTLIAMQGRPAFGHYYSWRYLMQKNIVIWVGYLFTFLFLILSCAGTELTQEQVDDAYKGKPVSDILVIAVTGNEHNRRSFEKKFVAHLKSIGVDAIASEEVIPMPADLKLKKETILDAVNQYKNDGVIITQLIGKEKQDVRTHDDAPRMGFFRYWRDPGYSSTSTTVRLETNLYDAKAGKLIWSGKSKTLSNDSADHIINDVIKAVINDLKLNKLVAPK